MSTPFLQLDVVTDEQGFLRLRSAWNALLDVSRANTLFLTWDWLHTWWRHCAGVAMLRIVVLREAEEVVAIAPCVLRPRDVGRLQLIPTLGLMGGGDVGSDYLDVIVKPGYEPEALAMLVAHLAQQAARLDLPAVHVDAQARLLAAGLAQRGWQSGTRSSDICPYIPMAGQSWDGYLASLGPEHRANFRRRLRKVQQEHGMRLERASTDDERTASLDTLIRLHNERWAERGGSTAFHALPFVMFHREMTTVALNRGWLRLYVLWVDEAPAAALYGFARQGKFYFYQAGFDARFAHLSVGLLIMGLAIRDAFAEGLSEYDFLHGDERYKFLWTRDARPISRLELYPPEARGKFYHAAVRACRRARRAAGQLIRTTQRTFGSSHKEVSRGRPTAVVPSTH